MTKATIAVLATIGTIGAGAIGYLFGKSAKEKEFLALQKEITDLVAIIERKNYEIQQIRDEIDEYKKSMSVMKRFARWVGKEQPELVRSFGEIERLVRERQQLEARADELEARLKRDFPEVLSKVA